MRNMCNQYTTLSKAIFKQAGWLSYCYFPLKRDVAFIWTNLNPQGLNNPRMLCAKFGSNWSSGSEENFWMSFMYFRYHLLLEKDTKDSQIWNSFTRGCFMPSLVEIGPVVLEQIFLNIVSVFSLFCYNLNFAEGYHLYLPFNQW